MSVAETEIYSTYAGNGSTTIPYPITISRNQDEDLVLTIDDVTSTDFSVSADGFRTGTAHASTVTLGLFRRTPRTQVQPFPSNTTPAAEDVRAGLDKLTLIVQEIESGDGAGPPSVNPFDQNLNTTNAATFTVLTANSANVVGVVNAGAITASGQATAASASISGNATMGTGTVTGLLTVGQVTLSGSALTSAVSIPWNASTNAEANLTLAHSATIALSNLDPRQSVSLSGTVGGVGNYTLAIGHAGLTTRVMGGLMGDIEALAIGGDFEVVAKRNGSQLRVWITTAPI